MYQLYIKHVHLIFFHKKKSHIILLLLPTILHLIVCYIDMFVIACCTDTLRIETVYLEKDLLGHKCQVTAELFRRHHCLYKSTNKQTLVVNFLILTFNITFINIEQNTRSGQCTRCVVLFH